MVRTLVLVSAAALALSAPAAFANPLGGQVKDGAATIKGEGTAAVTVNQSTDRAVIDWRTFNIGAGETTRFFVPNSSSITLNRVTGGLGPSTIYGNLTSNGQLVLINPNGILFGLGSVVDTAGLVATSHDIANADFMAGRMVFDKPGNPAASIINAGTITVSDGGFAALVAPGVRNEGVITARLGTVGLAAGNGFTLDLYGDGLINLKVGDEIAADVKDVRSGETLSALVSNAGTISADGGKVALTAATARRVVDSVVNNSGVIEANAVAEKGGTIVLGAATAASKTAGAPTQTVKVSGTLKAAGQGAGQSGGKIKVTGEDIRVADARLDASGKAGGGTVLVGGDVRGGKAGPAIAHAQAAAEGSAVPTASSVVIEPSVTIDVSATDKGNAGKAIVWSDLYTAFRGTILARGGASGGDGGFVEVSSAKDLLFNGSRDVSAPSGTPGLFLLDPVDLTVLNCGTVCGVNEIDVAAAVDAMLSATNDIVFAAAIDATGWLNATSVNGSIIVNAPIAVDYVNFSVLNAASAGSAFLFSAPVTARELALFHIGNTGVGRTVNWGELTFVQNVNSPDVAISVGNTGCNPTCSNGNDTLVIDSAVQGPPNVGTSSGWLSLTAHEIVVGAGISGGNISLGTDSVPTFTGEGKVTATERAEVVRYAANGDWTLTDALVGIDLSRFHAMGFGVQLPNAKLTIDKDLTTDAASPLSQFAGLSFGARELVVPDGRVISRDLGAGTNLVSGIDLWASDGGLKIGANVVLQADYVGLEAVGRDGAQNLFIDRTATLRGRNIDIWQAFFAYDAESIADAAGPLVVNGTIDLRGSDVRPGRLGVENDNGSITFDATLVQAAGQPSLIGMLATGDLTITQNLTVQGGMQLYAGGTLTLPGTIAISSVTLPDTSNVMRWNSGNVDPSWFVGRAGLIAVGATVQGASGGTTITRANAGVGGIAIVTDDGAGTVKAYLDGFTATEVQAVVGGRTAAMSGTGSEAVFDNWSPFGLTGAISRSETLTSASLLGHGIDVGAAFMARQLFVVNSAEGCFGDGEAFCYRGDITYVAAGLLPAESTSTESQPIALVASQHIAFDAPVSTSADISASAANIVVNANVSANSLHFSSTDTTELHASLFARASIVFEGGTLKTFATSQTSNPNIYAHNWVCSDSYCGHAGSVTFNSPVEFTGGLFVSASEINVNSSFTGKSGYSSSGNLYNWVGFDAQTITVAANASIKGNSVNFSAYNVTSAAEAFQINGSVEVKSVQFSIWSGTEGGQTYNWSEFGFLQHVTAPSSAESPELRIAVGSAIGCTGTQCPHSPDRLVVDVPVDGTSYGLKSTDNSSLLALTAYDIHVNAALSAENVNLGYAGSLSFGTGGSVTAARMAQLTMWAPAGTVDLGSLIPSQGLLAQIHSPGFGIETPNAALVIDSAGANDVRLAQFDGLGFGGLSLAVNDGVQIVRPLTAGTNVATGIQLWDLGQGLTLGSNVLLQADNIGLSVTNSTTTSVLSIDPTATLKGRLIEIYRDNDHTRSGPSFASAPLRVDGTIDLVATASGYGFLEIDNETGPIVFNATLKQQAGLPSIVSMWAPGDVTINTDLTVQGLMVLYAGGTLTLPGTVTLSAVTLPGSPNGLMPSSFDFDLTPYANRALFIAVGDTVQGAASSGATVQATAGAGATALSQLIAGTTLNRVDGAVGGIALVQDRGVGAVQAHLDGITATEVQSIVGVSGESGGNGGLSSRISSTTLTADVLAGQANPVYLPDLLGAPTTTTPDTPSSSTTVTTTASLTQTATDPLTQVTATPPIETLPATTETLIIDQSSGTGSAGSTGTGQGSQEQQGSQQGQNGKGSQNGQGGVAGGGSRLPPMPRTFDVPSLAETRFVPDEVLVRLDASLSPEQIAAIERQFGLVPLQRQDFGLGSFSFGRYRIPGGQDLRAVIAALSGNKGIMVGQPNYTYTLSQDAAAPAPGAAPEQAPAGGTQPASTPARALPSGLQLQYAVDKLRLPEAHQRARGREVVVAVIDSQIDVGHPEFKGALRKVIDATGGGAAEPHEHGTGMTGALAARAQLTGTAPASSIIGITAFRTDGKGTQGTTLSILNALDIAHREGARIVNMSFAGPRDPLLSRAIAEARQRGMILVAAAGNAGPKSPPLYPAADPNVIAVTAIDADDNAFAMANRGSYITVAAPGVDVLVPAPGGSFEFTSGTSVATAEISGLVALMLERDPSADVDDIKQALISSARDLGPKGPDSTFGAGAADAVAALQAMDFRTTAKPPTPAPVATAPKPSRPVAAAPGRSRLTPASVTPAR